MSVKGLNIFPQGSFDIEYFEEEDVECIFEPGSLTEDWHDIKMIADFNFLTMAYIKTYFMDDETKRSLTRSGIDPLIHYNIYDKNPIAVYTSGPMMIGLDIGKPPKSTEKNFIFGITLTNLWKEQGGKLRNITDVYVITPAEIGLLGETNDGYKCGKHLFRESSCEEIGEEDQGCDSNLHNVFKIDLSNSSIDNVELYETILCRFEIEDSEDILGDAPIATKYFKVAAKYDYQIIEELGIEVKGGDGTRHVLSEDECKIVCPDKDGCLCPSGCIIDKGREVSYLATCGGPKGDDNKTNLTSCSTKCEDIDGCICPDGCVESKGTEINKDADCGGENQQNNETESQTLLADCNTECQDNNGCICPDGCVVPKTNPIFKGDCGGASTT